MITSIQYESENHQRRASVTRMGPRSWLVTLTSRTDHTWSTGVTCKVRSLQRAQQHCRAWVDGSREIPRSENNC